MSNDVKIFGAMIIATVVLIVGAVFFLGRNADNQPTQAIQATIIPKKDLIKDESWSIGSPSAKVTVVEFGDFQCPSCKAEEPVIKELIKHYGDNIYFVYRHFPLVQVHQYALDSADAAEAAGMQGKFWEYHDKLYEISPDLQKENLLKAAKSIGLDEEKFVSDSGGDAVRQKVLNDIADGNKFGVNGTPTFFINGKKMEFSTLPTLAQFKSVIDPQLK